MSLRPLCRPLSFPCKMCPVVNMAQSCSWQVGINTCGTQDEGAAGNSKRGLSTLNKQGCLSAGAGAWGESDTGVPGGVGDFLNLNSPELNFNQIQRRENAASWASHWTFLLVQE